MHDLSYMVFAAEKEVPMVDVIRVEIRVPRELEGQFVGYRSESNSFTNSARRKVRGTPQERLQFVQRWASLCGLVESIGELECSGYISLHFGDHGRSAMGWVHAWNSEVAGLAKKEIAKIQASVVSMSESFRSCDANMTFEWTRRVIEVIPVE